MSELDKRELIVSGVQPSGDLHIGNYIGAISLWVENQVQYRNIIFVADLHALTIPKAIEPETLRTKAREIAALYIACGIDPKRSTIFLQSDVSAHPYLAWILSCCTPLGWLERMTQFKAKSPEGRERASAGLFAYPVLQAADILAYRPHVVPVGEDQQQHVELTRDIAKRFNHLYGDYFSVPRTMTRASGAKIMGFDDPSVKMSKSLAAEKPDHAVGLLATGRRLQRPIMSAVTDGQSGVDFSRLAPGVANLLTIYEAMSGLGKDHVREKFEGKLYGYLKREVVAVVEATLEPIQRKYRELVSDPAHLDGILRSGAEEASAVAEATLADVRRLVGVG